MNDEQPRYQPLRRPGTLIAGFVGLLLVSVATMLGGFMLLYRAEYAFGYGSEQGLGMLTFGLGILILVLTILIWRGKSWARHVLAVILAGNWVLAVAGDAPWSGVFGLLAVVLVYLPGSNRWFREYE